MNLKISLKILPIIEKISKECQLDFITSFNNLLVCGIEINGYSVGTHNCSNCKKCLRTTFSLYSINKLDEIKNVFDISVFEKK